MLLHLLAAASGGTDAVDLLTRGGPVGILAFVVVGFVRGWIVPGFVHKEACSQRDRATDLVYRMAETQERAAVVARETG